MDNSNTLDLKVILNNEKTDSVVNCSSLSVHKSYGNSMDNILDLLETQSNDIKNKPWSKLDKNNKAKILNDFIETEIIEKSLTLEAGKQMKTILMKALYNNLLNKQQDVIYDVETGSITKINSLKYNEETNTFDIKIKEKGSRVTTKSKTNIDRLISSSYKNKNRNKKK